MQSQEKLNEAVYALKDIIFEILSAEPKEFPLSDSSIYAVKLVRLAKPREEETEENAKIVRHIGSSNLLTAMIVLSQHYFSLLGVAEEAYEKDSFVFIYENGLLPLLEQFVNEKKLERHPEARRKELRLIQGGKATISSGS